MTYLNQNGCVYMSFPIFSSLLCSVLIVVGYWGVQTLHWAKVSFARSVDELFVL